jgi:sugar (pentulose or hexulose) kinase
MGEYLLSIDCGTQSSRVLVFDAEGRLLDSEKVEYEPNMPGEPGRAEQEARVYRDAIATASKALSRRRPELYAALAGVGVASQRDSLVCLDAAGEPLRPVITWLDQRKARPPWNPSLAWKLALALVGMTEAVAKTQVEGKTNWVMQNEPEIWERTATAALVSGYLVRWLCGRRAESVASMIAHLPIDYEKRTWADPRSRNGLMFPVPPEKLPELVEPGQIFGCVTREASLETGIPEGLPLVAVGSDKGCETLGSGVVDTSRAALSFGTTATVQTMSERYFEPVQFMPAYPAVIPGRFNPEVSIFRGYWMVSWFKRQFAHAEIIEAQRRGFVPEAMLDELLRSTPPGAYGLVMQPYWGPLFKEPASKGAIIGFGDVHERAHVYRAIVEGLAFGMRDGVAALEKVGRLSIGNLTVSGGGSRSDEICRISADVLGLPLQRGETWEATGLGAAMVVAAGTGLHSSIEAAARAMTRNGRLFEPDPGRAALYAELHERVYSRIYKALSPLYEAIREITNYPERT